MHGVLLETRRNETIVTRDGRALRSVTKRMDDAETAGSALKTHTNT